mmetsp:Transcript_23924/g.31134  ORF Transcript_23924/g.31134 Transcript_23924/m.31134 type:complete len:92 (-) Transcript_23924:219-494(-)
MNSRQLFRPITRLIRAPNRSIFAGQDAWRRHPMMSGCIKDSFPGLGYASAIFGAYLVISFVTDDTPAPTYPTFTYEKASVGAVPEVSEGGH